MKQNDLITKTDLAKRWSQTLVKKFAPKVEKEKKNIYGGITCYYSLKKVEKIEQDEIFKIELEKTVNRKAKSKETENKIYEEKIKEFLGGVKIELPTTKEKLLKEAVYHYNQTNWNGYVAGMDSDNDFLLRITQNYVRHMCSNYETILEKHFEGKYKGAAYNALKEHINVKVKRFLKNK